MTPEAFFGGLWTHYVAMAPTALKVRELLMARGERVVNDHVAFRTFNLAPIDLSALAAPFLSWGYRQTGGYVFPTKRLVARSYSHPSGNLPRVFLSELVTEAFSESLQETAQELVGALEPSTDPIARLLEGRTWPPLTHARWEALRSESEYAAWLAAFGLCANHFTVSVNALETIRSVSEMNDLLEGHGLRLNASGGKIKGGPEVFLEQSATLADVVPCTFAGGVSHAIPSCYSEFAFRHVLPGSDARFDGFVTESADRIFESTDTQPQTSR